jgi:hypothetical protein
MVVETSEFGSEEKPSGMALTPSPRRHGKSEMNVSYERNEKNGNYVRSVSYENYESCAKNAVQLC